MKIKEFILSEAEQLVRTDNAIDQAQKLSQYLILLKRAVEVIEDIKKHQEISCHAACNLSTTWNIANKFLEKDI